MRANSDDPKTARALFRTEPHGEHVVLIVDETDEPEQRIYEVRDSKGKKVSFLGSELDSMLNWWRYERDRYLDDHISLPFTLRSLFPWLRKK